MPAFRYELSALSFVLVVGTRDIKRVNLIFNVPSSKKSPAAKLNLLVHVPSVVPPASSYVYV